MGIKSLSKFLRDHHPEVFECIHISEYHFQKVAIDTSLYLCNYKALYGEEGWLGAFVKLVSCLRENEIHCVFIYDSSAPPEKEAERKERTEAKERMNERVSNLEDAIEAYNTHGSIDQSLLEFQTKRKLGSALNPKLINIKGIEAAVGKMRKNLFSVSQKDFEATKQLFDILDVPYFDAPMEAENMCADLCIQGKVDAVLSEDTDVMAYGAPVFLTKINTLNGTCTRIKQDVLLESIGLSQDEFLDFCIMCGTDYNKNIPKVGPVNAFRLIQRHNSIEKIRDSGIDVSILNHQRTRELFRGYKRSDVKVKYCGFPNYEKLQVFLTKKNFYINMESLKKSFEKNVVVYED